MSDSEASISVSQCEEDFYEIIKPAYDFKLTGLADGIGVKGMGHIEHNRSEQTKIIYLFSHFCRKGWSLPVESASIFSREW